MVLNGHMIQDLINFELMNANPSKVPTPQRRDCNVEFKGNADQEVNVSEKIGISTQTILVQKLIKIS